MDKDVVHIYKGMLLLLLLLSRFSHVQLCATSEMAAHQAPLSLGFSRQEYWSGLSFPSPVFQKNIYICFINYAKAFDCVDHNELKNSSKDGNIRTPYLPPEKSVCSSRSNS